jgi:hypothetical protein
MIKQIALTVFAAAALLASSAQARTPPDRPLYSVIDDRYSNDRDDEHEQRRDEQRRDEQRRDEQQRDEQRRDERRDDYADGRHGENGRDRTVLVRCESIDNHRQYCATGHVRSIQIVKRISDASCIQNRSWGRNGRGIWVDRGCRADFRVIR